MIWAFFKIGLFTIGGGYAMIPLITRELTANGWMTTREVADVIAIAKMTPGPFAANSATFAGMKIYGVGGAIACTAGVILPSFLIVVIVTHYFFQFQKSALVQGALSGVRPVVVALIGTAVWNVAAMTLLGGGLSDVFSWQAVMGALGSIDIIAVAMLAVMVVALLKFKIHPVLLITASGVLGILVYRLLPMMGG